jgi:hypothetical protein
MAESPFRASGSFDVPLCNLALAREPFAPSIEHRELAHKPHTRAVEDRATAPRVLTETFADRTG